MLHNLKDFISQGGRKLEFWVRSTNFKTVGFREKGAFVNINSMTDLQKHNTDYA